MKEPIERMAKALVDNPAEQVLVSELETGNTLVMSSTLPKRMLAKSSGSRQGRPGHCGIYWLPHLGRQRNAQRLRLLTSDAAPT